MVVKLLPAYSLKQLIKKKKSREVMEMAINEENPFMDSADMGRYN